MRALLVKLFNYIENEWNNGENFLKPSQDRLDKASGSLLSKPCSLTYIDSLSSGWEESENESPNLSKDISLLETKYRCLNMSYPPAEPSRTVPVMAERARETENNPSSDSSPVTTRKATEVNKTPTSDTSVEAKASKRTPLASKVDSDGDDSEDSSSSGTQSISVTLKEADANRDTLSNVKDLVEGKMESLKRYFFTALLYGFFESPIKEFRQVMKS